MADDDAKPNEPAGRAEIRISSDGTDAEIFVDGALVYGVESYSITHSCGDVAMLTLSLRREVIITGPMGVAMGVANG